MKKQYHIILGSNSPRRKALLQGLDLDFEVNVIRGVKETYPFDLPLKDVAQYIANEKADAYKPLLQEDTLIITADTIVIANDEVLGKPENEEEAKEMLRKLSGITHQVVTGVCITTRERRESFSVTTDVEFKSLSAEEIDYYVDNYKPLDKAGAYGIQEWIGYIGVKSLSGSYFNVMGFPVQRIYEVLQSF